MTNFNSRKINHSYQWILPTLKAADENISEISKMFNHQYPKFIIEILYNRGYTTYQAIYDFLNPSLSQLYQPDLLPDFNKAVERIVRAIKNQEPILIYGDYDVDGITGTSLLLNILRKIGAKISFYIPNRVNEGYGLSETGILYAKSQGFNFIITVDCGTVDFLEIQLANKLGIDIIVCDHHEPKEILPAAYAIVNPKRHDSTYPFAELGGVAVAFKLIWGVLALLKYPKEYLTEHLDLVALGLVADIVPLISENRILAKFGLKQISKTNKVGLQSLLKVAGILKREISPYEVSFILAPRINAAGRISNAEKVVTLLTTNNRHEAEIIAQQLNQENTQRQVIENQIFEESIKIIEAQNLSKSKIIVLSCDKWHEGVIGIVASKIAERYYRPSILLAIKGDRAKGSGRSISGFNIYEALKYCKDTLIGFGGHKYACGIEIAKDKIDSFIEKIQIYADNYLNINCLHRKIYIDAVLSFSQINDRTVKLLKIFEPFGQENPPLLFATHSLEVVGYPNRVGKDHLKFRVRENKDRVLEAIAFGRSSDILNLQIGKEDHVDIVYSFNEQYFAGKTKIQLNVKDLKIK